MKENLGGCFFSEHSVVPTHWIEYYVCIYSNTISGGAHKFHNTLRVELLCRTLLASCSVNLRRCMPI